ncbi:hypothetical protein ACFL5O_10345, partial [Myxococcota bacterium]
AGDTVTEETGQLDELSFFLMWALTTVDKRAPEPAEWLDLPIDVIPVDFVVRASHRVGLSSQCLSRTLQLANPRPPSARRIIELATASARKGLSEAKIGPDSLQALAAGAASRWMTRRPRTMVEGLSSRARYDTHHADQILGAAEIHCPPFEAYVDALVSHLFTRALGGALSSELAQRA